jgi:hypothetical protein
LQGLIAGWLGPFGVWMTVAMSVFGFFVWLTKDVCKVQPSWLRLVGHLRSDTPRQFYRATLARFLDWVDPRLSPHEVDLPHDAQRREVKIAWSLLLLNLAIALALAYPIVSLMLRWIVSGQGDIAGYAVFPNGVAWWLRAATVGALVLGGVGLVYSQVKLTSWSELSPGSFNWRAEGGMKLVLGFASPNLLFPGAVAFAVAYVGAGVIAVAGSFAVAFAVARAVAAAAAVLRAGALAVALARVGTFAFTIGVAGASTVAVAVATAVIFAVAVAGAGAVVVAGAVVFAVAAAFHSLGERLGLPATLLVAWLAFGFGLICTAVLWATGIYDEARGVILFIGMLPILNAAADFASIGLTRYWLRQGLTRNPVLSALKDALGGLAIFALLGCALIATLHFVRPDDGTPLVSLPDLFADLHANPGAYWWLLFMLFSTLLPTLAHLTLALFTLFTLAPPGLRLWIATRVEEGGRDGEVMAARLGIGTLCLLATAATVLPVFLLVEGLRRSPQFVQAVVSGFEVFARAIGAV